MLSWLRIEFHSIFLIYFFIKLSWFHDLSHEFNMLTKVDLN
jgi:hypothetical protein